MALRTKLITTVLLLIITGAEPEVLSIRSCSATGSGFLRLFRKAGSNMWKGMNQLWINTMERFVAPLRERLNRPPKKSDEP